MTGEDLKRAKALSDFKRNGGKVTKVPEGSASGASSATFKRSKSNNVHRGSRVRWAREEFVAGRESDKS